MNVNENQNQVRTADLDTLTSLPTPEPIRVESPILKVVETPKTATSTQFEALLPNTVPLTHEELMQKFDFSFIVGETDCVKGEINIGPGKAIMVRGTIDGNIKCEGAVFVLKEGKVIGNIVAGQVWADGEIGLANDGSNKSRIDAGTIHVGKNALIIADLSYDFLSMSNQNRGVSGNLSNRSHSQQVRKNG